MTIAFDDDTLLAALGDALAPEMVEPGPEELAELHRALESWLAEDDNATLAPVIPMFAPRHRAIGWASLHRLRHPVAALLAVGVLATSGVAAAGVATDHLPGPTRNVAFALGLPVTSPALEAARATTAQLQAALTDHDAVQVRSTADLLRNQLAGLSAGDRALIQASAMGLLAQAYAFLVAQAQAPAPAGAVPSTVVASGPVTPPTAAPASGPVPVAAAPSSAVPATSVATTAGGRAGSTAVASPTTTVTTPPTTSGTTRGTTPTTKPSGDRSDGHGSDDHGSDGDSHPKSTNTTTTTSTPATTTTTIPRSGDRHD